MLGLLNPTLSPLKAKIIAIAAGIVITLLLGALVTTKILWSSLGKAKEDIGALQVDLKKAVDTSNENVKVWDEERKGYKAAIETLEGLNELANATILANAEKQRRNEHALDIALNTIKETANASPDVYEWSVVRVPDAVIDSMCMASARATGEAETCEVAGNPDDRDPGASAGAVPDPSTT